MEDPINKLAPHQTSFTGKVLFVITKSNWGGAQWYVYTLATHLKKIGSTVAVAFGGTGEPGASSGRLYELLTEESVRTIMLPSFARSINVLREFSAFYELLHVIRREKPDVLHVNSSKAGGLGALAGRLAGVPKIIFTSHGLAYDEDRPLLERTLIWLATWATFLLAHTVIVISKDTNERARRLPFCSQKVVLIHNGIALQPLIERRAARAHLAPNAPQEGITWIGTIAETTHNKGLTYLVKAASLLKNENHKFVLCLMGTDGEERPLIEHMIAEEHLEDCVYLIGFVPHAATYLSAFDIFTLTSIKEGLPTVLLEAANAKCAVVTTGIAGVTDIVDDTTGVIVRPHSAEEIAYGITTLLHDEERRKKLGEALSHHAAETFSIDRMVTETVAEYSRPRSR